MNNFKEYYDNISSILESPTSISSMSPFENNGGVYATTLKFKEVGKIVDTTKYNNTDIDIYEYVRGKDNTIFNLWVPRGSDTGILYFWYVKQVNGIKELGIEQHPGILTKGLARYAYKEYYLKKFGFIISDNLHTDYAKESWRKMIKEFLEEGYKVTVIVNNVEESIKTPIEQYYSKTSNTYNICFKVYKK